MDADCIKQMQVSVMFGPSLESLVKDVNGGIQTTEKSHQFIAALIVLLKC